MPNIEALQQIRRVVNDAPDELLHMRFLVDPECGTARCAMGWAMIDPWFQKNTSINTFLPADGDDYALGPSAFTSMADLLGITPNDSNALFGGELGNRSDPHAVTKAEVLWNIDELLAGRSALPYAATEVEDAPFYAGGVENPHYYDGDDDDE